MQTEARAHSVLFSALAIVVAGFFAASCAETSEFLTERTHPEGWLDQSSENFHGLMVLQSAQPSESCKTCHGEDFLGGTSGKSCATCHAAYPHPEGFANPASETFHEAFFIEQLNWDLSQCQSCHGTDYAGEGEASKNCLSCHTEDDGPEACNTCHGSAEGVAPPEDLFGNSTTTSSGVGAHQSHLQAAIAAIGMECSHCHVEPENFDDPGHVVDGTAGRAEIVFGTLATRDGSLNPSYDFAALTCGNTYCHGGFRFRRSESSNPFAYVDSVIVGNNVSVVWNEVGTGQADCGTCHGLPPTGHLQSPACSNCHGRVVDAALNIIDPTLHINGEIEVF